MAAGALRMIRLRGKCALSTGVALGATFPAVGGWTFEIPQPPAKEFWRSDATPTPGYVLQTELTEADPNGTDLVVGLNIRGDGRQDVMRYIESTGQAPNAFRVHGAAEPGRTIDQRRQRSPSHGHGCSGETWRASESSAATYDETVLLWTLRFVGVSWSAAHISRKNSIV
jgi:SMODS-associated and fused to various effectors sensor domain